MHCTAPEQFVILPWCSTNGATPTYAHAAWVLTRIYEHMIPGALD